MQFRSARYASFLPLRLARIASRQIISPAPLLLPRILIRSKERLSMLYRLIILTEDNFVSTPNGPDTR